MSYFLIFEISPYEKQKERRGKYELCKKYREDNKREKMYKNLSKIIDLKFSFMPKIGYFQQELSEDQPH